MLILGGSGFIGSYITAAFINDKHEVICAVRDVERTKGRFPLAEIIACDFNQDITAKIWLKRLENIDIVVNVVGVLNSSGSNKIENVHINGPKALFDACVQAKVKRIIHISALGIDDERTTDYSSSKRTADNYLKTIAAVDWVILQPSLIYANGSYGGTSLLRGLASVPYFIFLMGDGLQQFQPVHMSDLTDAVLHCAKREGEIKKILKIVGPEIITVKDILINFRKWLGLKPAILISIPLIFIKFISKIGDLIGSGPLNSTSYKMMMLPNIADKQDFIEFTAISPKNLELGLSTDPLTLQSLWHARLFVLKPLLKWVLGLFWIATGVITGLWAPEPGIEIIRKLGFNDQLNQLMLYSSCLLDVILGALLIFKQRITLVVLIQISTIVGYTFILTLLEPVLWLEPLGSLTKNIPIILLACVLLAIERDK
ncbi:SDR family oxidoreductase [Candidatus Trichorickettsia mobilis]|uniref:SDR family oxidoreductase n=1 Tax=Candidatus Trichorickettsia mobilis TaxID=1346319 RepID=UPI002931E480|nr:SDR family oxidoreductase [Candidatus Trichorickettsia mobilis]